MRDRRAAGNKMASAIVMIWWGMKPLDGNLVFTRVAAAQMAEPV